MRVCLGLRSAQILALTGLCCWSTALRAQPADNPVRFEYVAEESCPDRASFAERVRRRTTQGREADPGEPARTFHVNVSRSAGGFLGVIEFLDDGGTTVMRRVSGEQCSAVVDSLALIAALALDASLREEEPPEPAEPKTTPIAPPPPVPTLLPPPEEISPPSESAGPALSTRIGGAAGYDTAISAPTFGLLGQVDLGRRFSLRLSTHVAWHDKGTTDERAARLRLLALETSGCFALLRERQFASSTCVWMDVGSLRAAGKESEELATASSATILWSSIGPELRLAWEPPVPFWADLRAQLGFPIVSHEFRFHAPDELVYRVPRVSAGAMISTGLRF